jgi:predicted Na+-dependent transporter
MEALHNQIMTTMQDLLHFKSDYSITNSTRHLSSIMDETWFNILAQILSNLFLFLLVFGMSATVDIQHLREQVHNKFAILTGLATQFIVMPLLGYLSVLLLSGNGGLTEPMAISLLIVTASPGGSYSNWWCSMFNADLALSITMTAIGTMVSSIMLPANLILYVNAAFGFGSRKGNADGKDTGSVMGSIDWASLFISLAIVVGAIASGLFASFKFSSHRFNIFANKMGSLSGVLLVVFSALLSTLSEDNNAKIYGQSWSFYVGVSMPCVVGLFIATIFSVISKLKRPEVITVGVECSYQNVGIATSAVVSMFSDPVERGQALCVPLFYGLVEAFVVGFYCLIAWKCGWCKAPRDEKFCLMIMSTYEVDDDEIESRLDEEESGSSDEEIPQTNNKGSPNNQNHGLVSWFNRNRKRTKSQETTAETESSDSVHVQIPPISSPVRRISVIAASAIKEGLDSITEGDFGSPGILVSFNNEEKEKGEYSRCRLNSDDSALTSSVVTTPEQAPNLKQRCPSMT